MIMKLGPEHASCPSVLTTGFGWRTCGNFI